jgi:hypothetical protein
MLGYFDTSDESAGILEPIELAVENQVLRSKLVKLETLLKRKMGIVERLGDALLEMSDAKIKLETRVEARGEQMLEANRKNMGQAMEIGALKFDKTNLECQIKEMRTVIGAFRDTTNGEVDHVPLSIFGEGEKLPTRDQIFDQRLLYMQKRSKKQMESLEALSEMISATADAMRNETREKVERGVEKYDHKRKDKMSGLEKQMKGTQTSEKEVATRSEEIAKYKTSGLNSVLTASTCMGRLGEAETEKLGLKDKVTDLERCLSQKTVVLQEGLEQVDAEKTGSTGDSSEPSGR